MTGHTVYGMPDFGVTISWAGSTSLFLARRHLCIDPSQINPPIIFSSSLSTTCGFEDVAAGAAFSFCPPLNSAETVHVVRRPGRGLDALAWSLASHGPIMAFI